MTLYSLSGIREKYVVVQKSKSVVQIRVIAGDWHILLWFGIHEIHQVRRSKAKRRRPSNIIIFQVYEKKDYSLLSRRQPLLRRTHSFLLIPNQAIIQVCTLFRHFLKVLKSILLGTNIIKVDKPFNQQKIFFFFVG